MLTEIEKSGCGPTGVLNIFNGDIMDCMLEIYVYSDKKNLRKILWIRHK